jgi:hypothetical protein
MVSGLVAEQYLGQIKKSDIARSKICRHIEILFNPITVYNGSLG